MIPKQKRNSLLLLAFLVISACNKDSGVPVDQDAALLPKRFNEVCFLMTHNSMNNTEQGFTVPNQTHSITHQLENGVRGLMLDTYDGVGGVAMTYHGTTDWGSVKLVDVMQEIKDFLASHKNSVISIIFQNEGSNTQLQKAIDSIGLNSMTYIHTGGTWPTLQTMVDSSWRLVLFVEQNKLPRAPYLMHAWSIVFDTEYSFSNTSEFDCDVNRGGGGSKELFLINHWLSGFLGLPDKNLAPQANARAEISHRVQECSAANGQLVNYLGVDFYEIGAAKSVVDSINGIE